MSSREDLTAGSKPISASHRKGSQGNLLKSAAGSKAGSLKNLAGKTGQDVPQTLGNPNAIVYENTYKTKPDKKFPAKSTKRLIEATLIKHLTKVKYDFELVPELTKTVANDLLFQIKQMNHDRYKFVIHVEIGEFKGQGVKVGSRALWDTTTDTFASGSFKNATLFSVVMVFASYFE